jgi:DNA modification methylase
LNNIDTSGRLQAFTLEARRKLLFAIPFDLNDSLGVPVPRPSKGRQPARKPPISKPELELQTTTLWYYPSQHYGTGMQGDKNYQGATPSYVIWNLLQRYTQPGDVVLDPMCGSGTTIDVCKDLDRQPLGFDLVPYRDDIKQSDARHLPIKKNTVDFVFVDPPYSTHIDYSDHGKCIGKLDAEDGIYYEEMEKVIAELHRVLKPGKYMGLYVSDSYKKSSGFQPIGFRLFETMCKKFVPIDIIAVTRNNRTLKRNHWHTSAAEGNFFLRGFNYLFIVQKPEA